MEKKTYHCDHCDVQFADHAEHERHTVKHQKLKWDPEVHIHRVYTSYETLCEACRQRKDGRDFMDKILDLKLNPDWILDGHELLTMKNHLQKLFVQIKQKTPSLPTKEELTNE